MTTSTPSRRRLFASPSTSVKRRRVMTQSKIPKSMQPELKQWRSTTSLNASGLNSVVMSIPSFMTQGNDGDQFLGSKFRIARVRVFFDYSDVTTTSGIRLALGIPKDPSSQTILDTSTSGTVIPHNMRTDTMLKELFLKTDGSNLNGYMEWSGPLNVEMNALGTAALKNNIILQINSDGVSASLASSTRTRVEVLFTG